MFLSDKLSFPGFYTEGLTKCVKKVHILPTRHIVTLTFYWGSENQEKNGPRVACGCWFAQRSNFDRTGALKVTSAAITSEKDPLLSTLQRPRISAYELTCQTSGLPLTLMLCAFALYGQSGLRCRSQGARGQQNKETRCRRGTWGPFQLCTHSLESSNGTILLMNCDEPRLYVTRV